MHTSIFIQLLASINRSVLTILICSAMTMAVFTACTSDNNEKPSDPDTPTEQDEYAILYYGYGGATLDAGLIQNIQDFYKGKATSYDKVKIAVQYKFSSIENIKKYMLDASVESGEMTQEEADEAYENLEPMGLEAIRFIVDPTSKDVEEDVLLNPENHSLYLCGA